MDQYDRTHNESLKQQINDVYDGFIMRYPDWTTNKYNDDIMWWTIGCTRAFQITKNERYLQKARASFDFVYTNFCDNSLGGGIWWSSDRRSKNSCVECPAIIAAVRLSELLDEPAYLEKARSLYEVTAEKDAMCDGNGKDLATYIRRTNVFSNIHTNTYSAHQAGPPRTAFNLSR